MKDLNYAATVSSHLVSVLFHTTIIQPFLAKAWNPFLSNKKSGNTCFGKIFLKTCPTGTPLSHLQKESTFGLDIDRPSVSAHQVQW